VENFVAISIKLIKLHVVILITTTWQFRRYRKFSQRIQDYANTTIMSTSLSK